MTREEEGLFTACLFFASQCVAILSSMICRSSIRYMCVVRVLNRPPSVSKRLLIRRKIISKPHHIGTKISLTWNQKIGQRHTHTYRKIQMQLTRAKTPLPLHTGNKQRPENKTALLALPSPKIKQTQLRFAVIVFSLIHPCSIDRQQSYCLLQGMHVVRC